MTIGTFDNFRYCHSGLKGGKLWRGRHGKVADKTLIGWLFRCLLTAAMGDIQNI